MNASQIAGTLTVFGGLLLLLGAFGIAAWRVIKGKRWSKTLVTILALAAFTGFGLVLNQRVTEFSFGKVASIKAAASQVEVDAKEVAAIRARVEAQAFTMDLVAKESSEAKRLLGELRKENESASAKLRELDRKTSDIEELPDGRIRTAFTISGRATKLFDRLAKLETVVRQGKPEEVFELAKGCIDLYEESAAIVSKMAPRQDKSVELNTESTGNMYLVGQQSALYSNKHDLALKWARKAVELSPTPQTKAGLIVCLRTLGQNDEARIFLEKALASKEPGVERFKELLRQAGVPIQE